MVGAKVIIEYSQLEGEVSHSEDDKDDELQVIQKRILGMALQSTYMIPPQQTRATPSTEMITIDVVSSLLVKEKRPKIVFLC